MAITTVPYGQFVVDIGTGTQSMYTDNHVAMLLTGGYTINQATDKVVADISAYELPNDSDPDGYKTGGAALTSSGFQHPDVTFTLLASSVSWAKLTGTVRYIVIRNSAGKLCGVCDLGTASTYTAQPFQVNFPDGLFKLVGV